MNYYSSSSPSSSNNNCIDTLWDEYSNNDYVYNKNIRKWKEKCIVSVSCGMEDDNDNDNHEHDENKVKEVKEADDEVENSSSSSTIYTGIQNDENEIILYVILLYKFHVICFFFV